MQIRDLLQAVVNLRQNEIVELARNAMEQLMPILRELDPEHDGCELLNSILLSALHADGKITDHERETVRELTGLRELDAFFALYQKDTTEKRVQVAVHNHTEHLREPVVMLIMAVAACDGTITKDEREYIETFL